MTCTTFRSAPFVLGMAAVVGGPIVASGTALAMVDPAQARLRPSLPLANVNDRKPVDSLASAFGLY
jgi:hypothetical protein